MKKGLFIVPIIYLILPFINIYFALLAVLCFAIPLTFLFKTKSRVFCTNYCPRSKLLMKTSKISRQKNAPRIFVTGSLRKFFLVYFIINMLFIITTTVLVGQGIINPMMMVRFMFVLPVSSISQIISIEAVPWVTHLAYRLYSMIFTTIIIGIVFAFLYRPRTWCQVCPITSVNNLYLLKK